MNDEWIGRTFDAWWEAAEKTARGGYLLRNLANGLEIELSEKELKAVAAGKSTVSAYVAGRGCRNANPKHRGKIWI